MGNNNVDTCARVCHSPTGYGLNTTLGTSAGTQPFDSVMDARTSSWLSAPIPTAGSPRVCIANETAACAKARQLIVVDPREIGLVRSPHIEAEHHHLNLLPGTNVPVINCPRPRYRQRRTCRRRLRTRSLRTSIPGSRGKQSILKPENSPEEVGRKSRVSMPRKLRAAARLFGGAGKRRYLLWPWSH